MQKLKKLVTSKKAKQGIGIRKAAKVLKKNPGYIQKIVRNVETKLILKMRKNILQIKAKEARIIIQGY